MTHYVVLIGTKGKILQHNGMDSDLDIFVSVKLWKETIKTAPIFLRRSIRNLGTEVFGDGQQQFWKHRIFLRPTRSRGHRCRTAACILCIAWMHPIAATQLHAITQSCVFLFIYLTWTSFKSTPSKITQRKWKNGKNKRLCGTSMFNETINFVGTKLMQKCVVMFDK